MSILITQITHIVSNIQSFLQQFFWKKKEEKLMIANNILQHIHSQITHPHVVGIYQRNKTGKSPYLLLLFVAEIPLESIFAVQHTQPNTVYFNLISFSKGSLCSFFGFVGQVDTAANKNSHQYIKAAQFCAINFCFEGEGDLRQTFYRYEVRSRKLWSYNKMTIHYMNKYIFIYLSVFQNIPPPPPLVNNEDYQPMFLSMHNNILKTGIIN